MQKQKLQQKLGQNLSSQQIQFLSLLQIPLQGLESRVQEELEENPALEECEEEINTTDLNSEDFQKSFLKKLTYLTFSKINLHRNWSIKSF